MTISYTPNTTFPPMIEDISPKELAELFIEYIDTDEKIMEFADRLLSYFNTHPLIVSLELSLAKPIIESSNFYWEELKED